MKKLMRNVIGLILLALLTVAVASPVAAQSFPDVIPLPNDFQPEGIAIGEGNIAYAGSLADGDIYTVDLRTGAGEILLEGPGTPAVGLDMASWPRPTAMDSSLCIPAEVNCTLSIRKQAKLR